MGNEINATKARNYDPVASHYELLAHIYSFGKIKESKQSQISEIAPNDKVLYAGVGAGEDAISAAKLNTHITCIDLSSKMLDNANKSFNKNGLENGEFICADIMEHNRFNYYDVVTSNFFLNIFTEPVMKVILEHLTKLLKSNGKLLIADFAIPRGNFIYRLFQKIHHGAANTSYWMQGLAPFHSVYDYPKHFPEVGLQLVNTNYFRLFKYGPVAYQSITSKKTC